MASFFWISSVFSSCSPRTSTAAIAEAEVNMIIGSGSRIEASRGERALKNLAKNWAHPKAVATNRVGNIDECEMNSTLKPNEIPNFAIRTSTGKVQEPWLCRP